ncbi:MAG: methyltransferase type 12 [Bacteroidota bacterium]
MREEPLLSRKDQYFDRLAFMYDKLVKLVFASSLKKAQCHFLAHLPEQGHLLILGGGSGWILEEIQKVKPELQIDYVEASQKMLDMAKDRKLKIKVNFIHGNEQMLAATTQYDALFTPFFLDLFGPLRLLATMSLLDEVLLKGGAWLFVDFYIPEKGLKRYFAKSLVYIMYRFFRLLCKIDARKLADFDKAFEVANYERIAEASFYADMISSRIYVKKA